MIDRLLLVVALAHVALAAQPSAPSPVAAPLRELQWGQLNVLHTTDAHGWHAGHLQQPSFSADWGDYIAFAEHLRARADRDGVDLLLIDTGDRIEGNGLYDGSEPRGKYTFDIVKQQPLDLICSGNHELYKQSSSEDEFYHTVPDFRDRYLASNLDIVNPETGALEPLAPRFRKFTTPNQGIRIMAFGFLFDFEGNANNTVVQTVADAVREPWFQDAIRDEGVDLFVVIGHADIRSDEFDLVFRTIRSQQWDAPIQFFGGHAHRRDFKRYDAKATALASGRYLETIGFLSLSGLPGSVTGAAKLDVRRRYIDNNLFSLRHHANTTADEFPTERGTAVTHAIADARTQLDLDARHGCAPRNLWLNRAPYPSNHSILSWLEERVLPEQVGGTYINETRSPASSDDDDDDDDDDDPAETPPTLVLTNTGAIRFDVFAGPFTHDTAFLVSPFTSGFRALRAVPYGKAKQLLKLLNNEGSIWSTAIDPDSTPTHNEAIAALRDAPLAPSEQTYHGNTWGGDLSGTGEAMDAQQILLDDGSETAALPPGYTTKDDAGDDGDDTVHARVRMYDVPNCVQARVGFPSSSSSSSGSVSSSDDNGDPETVDVLYNGFIEPYVLLALRFLGLEYEADDARDVAGGRPMTGFITAWVEANWGVGGEERCEVGDAGVDREEGWETRVEL